MAKLETHNLERVIDFAQRYSEYLKDRGGIDSFERGRDVELAVELASQELRELQSQLPRLLELRASADLAYDRYVLDGQQGCTCHINPPCNWCVSQSEPE